MTFRPDMLAQVLDGTKTMTRRRVNGDGACRYRTGRSYAIQPGRGRSAVARLRVTATRCERLGDIDVEDGRREGFADHYAFFRYWRELYGEIDFALPVWVISFTLEEPPA